MFRLHPTGIAKLGAVLRQDGHDVKLLDMNAEDTSLSDLRKCLYDFMPDFVGISYITSDIVQAREIRDCVKDCNPHTIVIGGGVDVSARREASVVDVGADIGVVGEGEDVIVPIVNNNIFRSNSTPLSEIKGLVLNDGKSCYFTGEKPPITNLDQYPFAAYDLLNLKSYRRNLLCLPLDFLTISTSRGCPGHCCFCFNSMGTKWRANSAKYVVDELEHNRDTLPIKLKSIIFMDDTFTVDKQRVYDICRLIKERKIDLTYKFETRVNLVDEDLLRTMYDVGFKHIAYGVESGNDKILEEWQKGITKDQIRDAFKLSHQLGYTTTAYMIVGALSETPDTVRESINFIKEIQPDFVQWSVACPLPATKLTEQFEKEFHKIDDWRGLYYNSVLSRKKPYAFYHTRYMTNEELQIWAKRAYRETYFNLRYVWKRVCRMKNYTEVKSTAIGVWEILNSIW